jgi:hypothetical protein
MGNKQKCWLFKQDMFAFHIGTTVHSTVNSPLSGMYGEWSVLVTLLICQLHEPKFSHFSVHFHSLFLDQNMFSPSYMGVFLSDAADWQLKYFGYIMMCSDLDHLPTASSKIKNAESYTSTLTYIFMASCLIKQRTTLTLWDVRFSWWWLCRILMFGTWCLVV